MLHQTTPSNGKIIQLNRLRIKNNVVLFFFTGTGHETCQLVCPQMCWLGGFVTFGGTHSRFLMLDAKLTRCCCKK